MSDFAKSETILNCWQNATKMRRWLITKKQSISEKLEYDEDKEQKENENLKTIIEKVLAKAEFLMVLDQPNAAFKVEVDEKDPENLLEKGASLMK